MSDMKDDGSQKDKKDLPPRKMVVTYATESKKSGDIPPEILPSTPVKVVSSPIDSAGNPAKAAVQAASNAPPKSRLHSGIPEEITPKGPIRSEQPQATMHMQESHRPTASASYSSGFDEPPRPPSGGDEMPPTPPPPPPPTSNGAAASNMALFLSLMTMVAVAALVFYTYLSQKNINELQSQSRNEQASVQSFLGKAKQSLAQIDSLQKEGQEQQKSFNALKTDLQNAQQRLVALSGSKNWVISEVNYLIFMANERLRVARDIPTAITQLQAAEEKITMLGDPALWGLKEAIAKDIAKLSTQPRVKKQVLWEQLNALQSLIEKTPFKSLDNELKQENKEQNIPIDESLPAWKKGLWRSWYEFKSLIRVTKETDNPIPNALSVQDKAEVLRTMQMVSQQAQWAVLQGESNIYLSSLNELENYSKTYFIDSPSQQTLLERIVQLKTEPVDSPLADISATLKALSNIR